MANEAQLMMRLPAELLERADALVEPVKQLEAYTLWRISRSAILRLAIQRGLEVLEREVARAGKKGGE